MLKLYTSNKFKQDEFKELFGNYPISIFDGENEKEVDGTITEIITYKSLVAGDNTIVEDTTAIVNGGNLVYDYHIVNSKKFEQGRLLVDIKHSYETLKDKDRILNISSLAVNRNGKILIFHGFMEGFIDLSGDKKDFLDSFMYPMHHGSLILKSMEELTNEGLRKVISWRGQAVEKFLKYELSSLLYPAFKEINIKDIPEWKGSYQ